VPNCFIEHGLNEIVKRLTGVKKIFNTHEMKCNWAGIYFGKMTDKNFHRQQVLYETKVTFVVLFSLPYYHRIPLIGTALFSHLRCVDESI
jgi:hypothetical protein